MTTLWAITPWSVPPSTVTLIPVSAIWLLGTPSGLGLFRRSAEAHRADGHRLRAHDALHGAAGNVDLDAALRADPFLLHFIDELRQRLHDVGVLGSLGVGNALGEDGCLSLRLRIGLECVDGLRDRMGIAP